MPRRAPGGASAPLPQIDFGALAAALLQRAEQLVSAWLAGGKRQGHEWVCGSLAGGAGASCSVNVHTGRWSDFATGETGGDLISLYAAIHGLDQARAAVQVAREEALESVAGVAPLAGAAAAAAPAPRAPRPPDPPNASTRAASDEGWCTVVPVPPTAPAPTYRHIHRAAEAIVHRAAYRWQGDLFGYVVRFRTSDGGKDTLPYTWCTSARDGASRWHWRQWDEPRPLYLPAGDLPPGCTVVVVEGEVKADALQAALEVGAPGVYRVASWPGGCKAWAKARWDWLAGASVLLWPDGDAKRQPLTRAEREQCGADKLAQEVARARKPLLPAEQQPGMEAMLGVGALLRDAYGCTVALLPIPQPGAVADGWDAKDALDEGWDFARLQAFFAGAAPLVAAAGRSAATGGSGGSGAGSGGRSDGGARDGLADAGSGGSGAGGGGDDDGAIEVGGRHIPRWLAYYWDAEKSRWLVSRKLVIAALQHHEALALVLSLNELSNNIDARVDWPWPHGRAGAITGTVDLMLGDYLTQRYGLPSIPRAALMEAIETVAHGRRHHPVRDYLQGLRHDGVARLDRWLIHAIGETPESLHAQHGAGGAAIVEYLTLVGRFWLLGMVNRVMHPGCKFDYCPVLEGPGGYGKSTLVEVLASTEFFSDTHFDVSRGKEGQEQVQGLWLYEIAELANFGRAEIGLIKAFITAKVDRYRPSYGRTVESYPRQCVLVGTTNEYTYLRDRTGNRRFWPIPIRQRIRIDWVRKWRDQLFAEAMAQYRAGARFTPTYEEEERLFVPMQESRLVETAVTSELWNVLTRQPVVAGIGAIIHGQCDFATMAQLTQALGADPAKSNAALEGQIRSWLEHEGWLRQKRQVNGVRAWGYVRPRQWPADDVAAPSSPPMQQPTPVAAALRDIDPFGGLDDEPF